MGTATSLGLTGLLAVGLLTNLLNPKTGVFCVTLLPRFIPRGGSIMTYSFIFAFVHVAEGLLWLALLTSLQDLCDPGCAALRSRED